MIPNPLVTLPQDLSPDTAIALFDILNNLSDAIRQQYGDEWNDLPMPERYRRPASEKALDFDDDIPF